MSSDNPFAPATITGPALATGAMPVASQNRRFLNLIIDNIFIYIINYGIGLAVATVAFPSVGTTVFQVHELSCQSSRWR